MRLAPVVVALAIAACTGPIPAPVSPTVGNPEGTTSITEPPATAPTPSEPVHVAGPETVPCHPTPPIEFAVLCDSYERIVEHHLDEPDAEGLAAAAVLGVSQVAADSEPAATPERLRCAVPDPAFERLCETVWARLGDEPGSLDALMEGAVRGMFRYGLDPFSAYIPDSEIEAGIDPTGVVVQLGLTVGARDAGGAACSPIGAGCRFEVLTLFERGPADAAGLAVGDVVTRIDGRDVEGLAGEEATALLFGEAGSAVELVIDRGGHVSDRELIRSDVRFVPSEFRMIGDVAHVRLNDFSQRAAQDLGVILAGEEMGSVLGIVLDLRDNPGGLVVAAQAVASQFLDGGDVLTELGRDFEVTLPVLDGGLATSGPPMAVLVNRGTASAAEIVAAVLQERQRAVIVGSSTFGKGLVQEVTTSRDGGQIRLTVARWVTPEGLDIGLSGLEPDVVVEPDSEPGTDSILEAGLSLLGG